MKPIENLTIAEARELIPQARELLRMFGEDWRTDDASLPYPVGTPVYWRGAIYSVTGRIIERRGEWILLGEAAYVGTDGRFSVATEQGVQYAPGSEIEPVGGDGTIAVHVGACSDVSIHPGELPRKVRAG